MSNNRSALPVINTRADHADKVAYFLAVFGGMGLIVFLRVSGFQAVYVALVPLVCIVLYAAIALHFRGLKLREDRIADNCYYLGFIYTLTSLAYALWSFQSKGLVTEQLIQDFGVALSSTIVGVIARLLINQMRIDPVEVEQSARATLAEASEKLKTEMILATTNFETYRVAMHQSYEEAQKQLSESMHASITAASNDFTQMTKQLLDDATKTFQRHGRSADKLEKAGEQMAERIEALVEKLDAIDVPSDLLTSRLSPAIAEIERAASGMRHRTDAVSETVEKIVSASGALAAQVDAQTSQTQNLATLHTTIASGMEGLSRDITSLSEFANLLQKSLSDIEAVGATSSTVLEGIAEDGKRTLDMIRQHNTALSGQLSESEAMYGRLQQTLVLVAESMLARLREQAPPVDAQQAQPEEHGAA